MCMTEKPAPAKKNPLGASGRTVARNVQLIRARRNIGYAELSRKLEVDHGRQIPPLGLSRIENGERRVDADDLIGIAAALGVSPITLLMPDESEYEAETAVAATGFKNPVTARRLWNWLRAEEPINFTYRDPASETAAQRAERGRGIAEFMADSVPYWLAAELMDRIRISLEREDHGDLLEGKNHGDD